MTLCYFALLTIFSYSRAGGHVSDRSDLLKGRIRGKSHGLTTYNLLKIGLLTRAFPVKVLNFSPGQLNV